MIVSSQITPVEIGAAEPLQAPATGGAGADSNIEGTFAGVMAAYADAVSAARHDAGRAADTPADAEHNTEAEDSTETVDASTLSVAGTNAVADLPAPQAFAAANFRSAEVAGQADPAQAGADGAGGEQNMPQVQQSVMAGLQATTAPASTVPTSTATAPPADVDAAGRQQRADQRPREMSQKLSRNVLPPVDAPPTSAAVVAGAQPLAAAASGATGMAAAPTTVLPVGVHKQAGSTATADVVSTDQRLERVVGTAAAPPAAGMDTGTDADGLDPQAHEPRRGAVLTPTPTGADAAAARNTAGEAGAAPSRDAAPAPASGTLLPRMVASEDWAETLAPRLLQFGSQGGGRMTVQLHPLELGSMDLALEVDGDEVRVSFVVQQSSARELLDQHLPRLREMLAAQGFDNVDVDVSSGDDGAGQSAGQSQDSSAASADGARQQSEQSAADSGLLSMRTGAGLIDAYA